MLFLRHWGRPKDVPPSEHWPFPRSYWNPDYYDHLSPDSWTEEGIEAARRAGWTNVVRHERDEFPYMVGQVSGNDPERGNNWYLPHLRNGVLEY